MLILLKAKQRAELSSYLGLGVELCTFTDIVLVLNGHVLKPRLKHARRHFVRHILVTRLCSNSSTGALLGR